MLSLQLLWNCVVTRTPSLFVNAEPYTLNTHEWSRVQSMSGRVYVTDQDAEEPEDFIVGLTTQVYLRPFSFLTKGASTELKLRKYNL